GTEPIALQRLRRGTGKLQRPCGIRSRQSPSSATKGALAGANRPLARRLCSSKAGTQGAAVTSSQVLRHVPYNRPSFDGTEETMKKLWITSVFIVLASSSGAGLAADSDARFQHEFGESFFAQWWRAHPDSAIENGYYATAERIVVPDEPARAQELKDLQHWLTQLHGIKPDSLSPSVRADWVLLENLFNGERWEITDFRDWQWDPSLYNVAEPIALLLSTEYAPLEERLR